jgi:hypothetical protein
VPFLGHSVTKTEIPYWFRHEATNAKFSAHCHHLRSTIPLRRSGRTQHCGFDRSGFTSNCLEFRDAGAASCGVCERDGAADTAEFCERDGTADSAECSEERDGAADTAEFCEWDGTADSAECGEERDGSTDTAEFCERDRTADSAEPVIKETAYVRQ